MSKNDSIDYDNLTYSDIFSTIKKFGSNMCNDKKLLKYQLQNQKKAKYKMGNFCKQYGLSPIAPSGGKGKKNDKSYSHKKYKKYKNNFVKPNDFHAKKKNVSEKNDKQLGKLKNEFKMLNINNKDQEELFKSLNRINRLIPWKMILLLHLFLVINMLVILLILLILNLVVEIPVVMLLTLLILSLRLKKMKN